MPKATAGGRDLAAAIDDQTFDDLPESVIQHRVLSLERSAEFCDLSPATFERLIASGRGPRVLHLSERRRGCRVGNLIKWLASREVA